jgi:pimeloyl-ACP methyl ester carboxylesterase
VGRVTSWARAGRVGGLVGAAAGLAAAGAAVGLAAERFVMDRAKQGPDPYADEPFGALRGTPYVVVASDGVELHAELDEPRGAAGALDVTAVFCHGYALNLDTWHFQRRDLAGVGRLVFYDQRSHGRSGRAPAASVSLAQLGRDLEHVVEALAPDGPVVLVGHSMGGMTLMALAGQRPHWFGDRVRGVALIATSSGGMDTVTLGVPGAVGRAAHRLAPQIVTSLARQPTLVDRTRRAGSDLGHVLTKHYSFGPDVPPSLVAFTADLNAATPIGVIADFLPLFDVHDEEAALAAFHRVETLVVGAARDELTPVEHSRTIVRAVPDAEYLELDDAGHMVLLERHEQVTERVRGLLERVAAG